MERDLAALALLANLAQRRTPFGQGVRSGELLAQFAKGLRAELDFRHEADAMSEMAALLRRPLDGAGPDGLPRRCRRRRVLVQERFEGVTVSDIGRLDEADGRSRRRSPTSCCAPRSTRSCASALFHADPHPGNVFALAGRRRSASSTSAPSAASTRSSRRRSSTSWSPSPAATSACSATASSGSPSSPSTTSPDELERALARLLADHVRPGGVGRSGRASRTWSPRCPASACACRPTSCCCRGRWSPSTARCASWSPTCRSSPRRSELVDRKDGPRRRRPPGAGPRRAAGDAAAPAPPARAGRPHPHPDRPRRAARAQRRRRGQPADRAHARQPAAARARRRRRSSSRRPGCSPSTDDGPADRRADRAVRGVRLRRPAASAPCSSCGWSPPSPGTGRHDVERHRRRRGRRRRRRRRAGRRSTTARPASATTAIPATSIRLVVWGLVDDRPRPVRRAGRGDQRRAARGPRRRRRPDPRRRPRSWPSPSPRSPPSSSRSLVVAVAGRPAALAAAAPSHRSPRRSASAPSSSSTAPSASPDRVAEALDDDFWLIPARFPSPACARRGGRRRRRRQAVAGAGVAAQRRPLAPARRSSTILIAGSAGLAEVLLAVSVGDASSAPPCSSCSAPRTAGRPRAPSPTPSSAAGLPVTALTLERATGGRAQLYRADARRRHVRVRQGVRPGQPGRRPAVPRLPRRCCCATPATSGSAASLERAVEHEGLLLLLARRAGVRCPDLRALVGAARRVDGPRHGGRRRASRSTRSTGRAQRRAARCRVAAGCARSTPPGSPTGRCGRRTSSSTGDGPVIVDFGSAEARGGRRGCRRSTAPSCSSRWPTLAGPEAATASAARMLAAGRSGRRHAVRAAAGADGGHAPRGVEVAAQERPRRGRRRRRGSSRSRSSGSSGCGRARS